MTTTDRRTWWIVAAPKKSGTMFCHQLIQSAIKTFSAANAPGYYAPPVSQWYPIIRPQSRNLYRLADDWRSFSIKSASRELEHYDRNFLEQILREDISSIVSSTMKINSDSCLRLSIDRIKRLFAAYPTDKPLLTVDPNFSQDVLHLARSAAIEYFQELLSTFDVKVLTIIRDPVDRLKSYIQMQIEHEGVSANHISRRTIKSYSRVCRFTQELMVLKSFSDVFALDFRCMKKDPVRALKLIGNHLGTPLYARPTFEIPKIPNRSSIRATQLLDNKLIQYGEELLMAERQVYDELFASSEYRVLGQVSLEAAMRRIEASSKLELT